MLDAWKARPKPPRPYERWTVAKTFRNNGEKTPRNVKLRARERAYAKAAALFKDAEEQVEIDADLAANAEALDRLMMW